MQNVTISDVFALHAVVDAASRCAPVARLVGSDVVYGTARSVGDQEGRFLASGEDVRGAYLRVTTSAGWEVFWPVAELAAEVPEGAFVVDYRP